MADPRRKAAKYECRDKPSFDSPDNIFETDNPSPRYRYSEEFVSLIFLFDQTLRQEQWLESLKILSHIFDHCNTISANQPNYVSRQNRSIFNSGCVDGSCNYQNVSQSPDRNSRNRNCIELNDMQSALQFKADYLSVLRETLFHVRRNDCLQPYMGRDVQQILEPIRNACSSEEDVLLPIVHLYFSLDLRDQALQLAHEITQSNPESVLAQETFENICCHAVDRWHFKMLNDVIRNKAFESAIKSVVLQQHGEGSTVCDIGSGTGLLSFISAKYAQRVYAIEKSSLMCDITQNVMNTKEFNAEHAGKIVIVNEMSTSLSVPENFPARADILVTETFDAGLFGEGIISTLSHAWRELLARRPDKEAKVSAMIPQCAKLYVEAISSFDIRQEHSFHHNCKLGDISLGNASVISVVGMVQSDPYTSYHLRDLPHGFKSLSDANLVMEVNFNDPKEIFDLEKSLNDIICLDVKDDGCLDALVIWFQLVLTDSIRLSTHPGSEGCWEQAVFPIRNLNQSHSKTKGVKSNLSLTVRKGDKVSVKYCLEEDRLCLHDVSVLGQDDPQVSKDGSDMSQHLATDPTEWWSRDVFCLSEWEILMLNYGTYHKALYHHTKLLMDSDDATVTCLVDLHPGFCPITLQALSEGCLEVILMTPQETQKALACKLAQINKLDLRRIDFFQDASELLEVDLGHLGDLTQQCSSPRAALALCEVVDHEGRLAENLESCFEYLRFAFSSFSSRQILPQRVDVYGIFIDSERLRRDSCIISDENTLGFPIGRFLNQYSVSNYPGITLSTLPHYKLTDAFKIFSLDLMSVINTPDVKGKSKSCDENVMNTPDIKDESKTCDGNLHAEDLTGTKASEKLLSDINVESSSPDECQTYGNVPATGLSCDNLASENQFASNSSTSLLCDSEQRKVDQHSNDSSIFDQTVDLKIPVTKEGRLSAMLYWFDIHLSPFQQIRTDDPSYHWKQAAIVLENEMVLEGQELLVNIRLKNSNFKVKVTINGTE